MPCNLESSVGDRSRERLLRMGPSALSEAELIAVVLGDGSDDRNAVALGQCLIEDAGGIARLAAAFPEELLRVPGVGPSEAARLVAAFELATRATAVQTARLVDSASAIAELVAPALIHERREKLLVLVTDPANRLLRLATVASGGVDSICVPVREVLHAVLRFDGRAFALAHNHPSGDPTPSRADLDATEAIRLAADAVGLRFLDHVVIGGSRWRSVR